MFPKGGKRSVGANRQGKTSRKETRLMLKNRHVSVQTQRERETEKSLSDSVDRQMSETDVSEGVRVGDSANISISV